MRSGIHKIRKIVIDLVIFRITVRLRDFRHIRKRTNVTKNKGLFEVLLLLFIGQFQIIQYHSFVDIWQ